jgi:hypothetical protein
MNFCAILLSSPSQSALPYSAFNHADVDVQEAFFLLPGVTDTDVITIIRERVNAQANIPAEVSNVIIIICSSS